MIEKTVFVERLARRARVREVRDSDVLFGSGLDLGSLAFTEFVMEIEELYGIDIDPDKLDASIVTVGQLYERLNALAEAPEG